MNKWVSGYNVCQEYRIRDKRMYSWIPRIQDSIYALEIPGIQFIPGISGFKDIICLPGISLIQCLPGI